MEGHELALACAKALSDKKAQDIVILDVRDQTIVCSYFVIASGRSTTQVKALCENSDITNPHTGRWRLPVLRGAE